MKKYIIFFLAILIIPACGVQAQKKKGKKVASPIIEGKQKVRKTDYDSVWKFTVFNPKKKTMYYCNFDYSQLPSILDQKVPDFLTFQPVMNYLSTNARATMTIVAVYGINPAIQDDAEREVLSKRASEEALAVLQDFEDWMTAMQYKNKMVFQVAQIDYRYWHGTDYFNMPPLQEQVVHVGLVMALTNKKVEIFPDPSAGARAFKDVKFLPNDATVVRSYYSMIDSLADYVMSNERYEVLLTGYSDNVGTPTYNRGLSNQRATEIKKMLLQRGVPEYRIEIVARGENDPIADNNTYEGRVANNRVSIKIQ
ncbi:MAG: OmpA family protein [Bacteroidales bacterium]|nr:OmpA family protein [Bacteroidales bacterium]